MCAKINNWTDTEKGLYLAVSLRGQAQWVFGNLPLNARQDFDELIRSLEERFSPSNQTKSIIDIDINGYVCSNVAIVADINVDGILGLDVQRSQNCTINVAKGNILIHGHKVSLQFEGQIECYQVATAKTVRMPPRRDVIVKRKV